MVLIDFEPLEITERGRILLSLGGEDFALSVERAEEIAEQLTEAVERARAAAFVDDDSRCAVCAWPLQPFPQSGCTRGNCAQRPRPDRLYAPERAEREAL